MSEMQSHINRAKTNVAFLERRIVQQEMVISRLALLGKSTVNAEAMLSKIEVSTDRSRIYLSKLQALAQGGL